ncbi:hypothetical protein [Acinetobacter sp. NRRL B-65365]|uniref:hypothetical protein n=1 Tax=Acinetobacter sp. NRRL B-65365 TaxID=1785092 RepID=UPI000A729D85|nr:hypothetical protein [Acinetobacter sp. NRRL B-65365]
MNQILFGYFSQIMKQLNDQETTVKKCISTPAYPDYEPLQKERLKHFKKEVA